MGVLASVNWRRIAVLSCLLSVTFSFALLGIRRVLDQAHVVAEVAEQAEEMDRKAHFVAEVAEQAAKMD